MPCAKIDLAFSVENNLHNYLCPVLKNNNLYTMIPYFCVLASFSYLLSLSFPLFIFGSPPDQLFLNTTNFFEGCEIYFINQRSHDNNNTSSINKAFGTILQKNLYTPLTIQVKYLKSGKRGDFTHSREQRHILPGKSSRVKVTFMNLVITKKNSSQDELHDPVASHNQLLTATRTTDPAFLFIYVKFPPLAEYYLNYAAESSRAILVLVNLSNPKVICIRASFVFHLP